MQTIDTPMQLDEHQEHKEDKQLKQNSSSKVKSQNRPAPEHQKVTEQKHQTEEIA